MKYLIGAKTDIGIKRKTNQDALSVKIARCSNEEVAFAVLCDGMGGLECGEIASTTVINRMSEWFLKEYPEIIDKNNSWYLVRDNWDRLLKELNRKLVMYGENGNEKMGTTCVAVLIKNEEYLIANVGDSRAYLINNNIQQLTHDQSLIAREIAAGRMTAEAAKTDSRKNVLLQCIGANNSISPEYVKGKLQNSDIILLCSDGFVHEITDEEIARHLQNTALISKEKINDRLQDLINLNKERNEKDNISALAIKLI